jgi:YVTN family beta-propeller protein
MKRSNAPRGACLVGYALRVSLVLGAISGAAACFSRDQPEPVGSESAALAGAGPSFTAFESGQVRPLALSQDNKLLFAVNTPDNRLEIFQVLPAGLNHVTSVMVGLEPVAVAVAGNNQVWVVNHLSDSVSIVDLSGGPSSAKVTRTLLVGDEPRDIVFAGPGLRRAFVTTAHRGQNTGIDPQLTTPGVGRADVWAFDAENLGGSLGGTPLAVVTLFTDTPRALAVSPDGSTVYAAGFQTGNQTTTVSANLIVPGGEQKPPPSTNYAGIPAPGTGLIVKFNGQHWVDQAGGIWDQDVALSLPDTDVFAIDALANPPEQRAGAVSSFAHVGTVLFNMAVNPVSGKVYVSNLDSHNQVQFSGPGIFTNGGTVQGRNATNQITVLDPGSGAVSPINLNPHIDYSSCCAPIPNAENAKSLAFPTGMAVTGDGQTLYVTALGSSKVGVYSTEELESNTFTPSTHDQVVVSGGGPTGLVLDEARGKLYVLTRFDDSISVIDTASKTEVAHVGMFNPEPPSITIGRRFLYDASFSSSHGDAACATCHIFGDFDSLAWDLGNPDADMQADPNPFDNDPNQVTSAGGTVAFHPMKGPMTTQSLRGMANHGPMHWRGDHTAALTEPNVEPNSGAYDTQLSFQQFNTAFTDVIGRGSQIPDEDMQAFGDFILQVMYPPNPIRNLDDSDTPDQAAGRAFYLNTPNSADLTVTTCVGCHLLNPNSNAQYGVPFPGSFGSDGHSSFVFESQLFKNAHLRNEYQKVGMFGNVAVSAVLPGNNGFQGDQVRGFGFLHDGTVDTDFRFVSALFFAQIPGFNDIGIPATPAGDTVRRQLEQFMLGFPSNLKPIVGQQITLTASNASVVAGRIQLLEQQAAAGSCDLVAKAGLPDREHGFLYGGGQFICDQTGAPPLSDAGLRGLATGNWTVTFTCVPPGSGVRIGIDRNNDGILDGDEHP